MPLMHERDGLFRGRANDSVDWYVVSPSVEEPAAEVQRWRTMVAKSNRPVGIRVLATVLGWFAFVALCAGTVALLWFVGEQRWPGWPLYCFGISVLGLIAAVIAGLAITSLFDRSEYVIPTTDTVMVIDSAVAEWAKDETPVADLWKLSAAIAEADESGPDGEWDSEEERWRRPSALHEALKPLMDEHRARSLAQLAEIAGRLGYPLNPDDRATPER